MSNSPTIRPLYTVMTRLAHLSSSSRSDEMKMMPVCPPSAKSRMSPYKSALVPTSIPLVGSSRMSTFGDDAMARPMMAFC